MRLLHLRIAIILTFMSVLCMAGGSASAGTPDTVAAISGLTVTGSAGVATDALGNYYVANAGSNKVLIANVVAGVTTFTSVGTGTAGFVPFTATTTIADATIQFSAPSGAAVDANGNVYIADTGNHRVHMIIADPATKLVSTASRIITIAGNGIGGFAGDGLTATSASLKSPTGVAVDIDGNVYIADNGNYRVRKMLAVKSTTDSTTGVTTYTSGVISTIAGDGTATTLTAYGIALAPAPAGDLYIADAGNNRILKLTAAKGAPAVYAGTGIAGFSGDGSLATQAQLNQPSGVATNGKDLFIADTMNNCVRKIALATGVISTRLGTVAQAAAITIPAAFASPVNIAVDAAGTVFVQDTGNSSVQQVFAGISAITTASPPGGTYATAQSVTLTPSFAAKVYYTTDGTTPTALSTVYTTPISIAATTPLKFISIDVAGTSEVVNTAIYTINTVAPKTSIVINATPVNGIYYSALSSLSVSMTTDTPSASVYYTTTGKAPTTASTRYTAPIAIPVTTTLTTTDVQFFAADVSGLKEVLRSQKYQIAALTTTASPAGGTYGASKSVTLAANSPSAVIYYTTDGSDPTLASAVYAAPVTIAANTTLKYRAKDTNGNLEQVRTQVYVFDTTAPTAAATPVGGGYNSTQSVTLSSNETGATIYYSITGIAPTTSSSKYSSTLTFSKTTTLMFFAVDTAGNKGAMNTEVYVIDSVTPVTTASVLTGTYASVQSVKLVSDDPKATIYFTVDGSTPTTASSKYSTPLTISATTTLKYFAMDTTGNKEPVKTQEYTIITLTTTAYPKGGVFNKPQSVVLSANSSGTTYYTVDGTVPSTTSKTTLKYSSPILLQSSKSTVMFYTEDSNGVIESVKTEIYSVDTTAPTTVAKCGAAANTITLTATDDLDALPKIMYSVSDSVTHTGTAFAYYTAGLTFTKNTIIKFFAVDTAGNTENVQTSYCPTVAAPLDTNPAMYLQTLAGGASTSNGTLFVTGNVGPFASVATLTLDNGGGAVAPASSNVTDGSFTYSTPLPAAPGTLTLTTTAGTTTDTRIITSGVAASTSLAIGSSDGAVNHNVRVPITLTSGFQASAVSIDIAYNPATSRLANPKVEIARSAAALDKSIQGGIPSAGVYRILIMDTNPPATGTTKLTPLPDGVIAYLSFTIPMSATAGVEPLTITSYSATDLDAATIAGNAGVSGSVNVVSKPGNTGADVPVTLPDVIDALYMLLDPVTHPVSGSVDLNADGTVQIYELQQVINSFLE